jgi:hypothetical protein
VESTPHIRPLLFERSMRDFHTTAKLCGQSLSGTHDGPRRADPVSGTDFKGGSKPFNLGLATNIILKLAHSGGPFLIIESTQQF